MKEKIITYLKLQGYYCPPFDDSGMTLWLDYFDNFPIPRKQAILDDGDQMIRFYHWSKLIQTITYVEFINQMNL